MTGPEPGDRFTVRLNQDNLRTGLTGDPEACPVARALRRSGKVERPRVGTVVRALPGDTCLKVVEPENLLERIDGGENVDPCRVTVEVVEGYDTYEDAKEANGGLTP